MTPGGPNLGAQAPRPAVRLDAVVDGRVQGVGFRYFAADRARALGLTGWVANRPDGTVRCGAEGPEPALREFAEALRGGPLGARVASVGEAWSAATGEFEAFGIRSGSHPGD